MITMLFSIRYEPITDFELTSQTESERLAEDAKIKLLEQQKTRPRRKGTIKSTNRQKLNDFRLTGSSLPSDVAASYGQGDMFVNTRGQKLGENNVPKYQQRYGIK